MNRFLLEFCFNFLSFPPKWGVTEKVENHCFRWPGYIIIPKYFTSTCFCCPVVLIPSVATCAYVMCRGPRFPNVTVNLWISTQCQDIPEDQV